MKPLYIAASAIFAIAVQTLMPEPFNHLTFAVVGLAFARVFYRLGGRWSQDYSRATIEPNFWQNRQRRTELDGFSLWYRASIIFTVLFICAAVVL